MSSSLLILLILLLQQCSENGLHHRNGVVHVKILHKQFQKTQLKLRKVDKLGKNQSSTLHISCLSSQCFDYCVISANQNLKNDPWIRQKFSPFISPLLLTMTPALSSKYMNTPSFLRIAFRCRMTTAGITTTTTDMKQCLEQPSQTQTDKYFNGHFPDKPSVVDCSLDSRYRAILIISILTATLGLMSPTYINHHDNIHHKQYTAKHVIFAGF